MFVHIVAKSVNDVIGNKGNIPWKLPSDLKFFKEKTMGKICIVGRKTYETIRHLKGRKFIVISSSFSDSSAIWVNSIDEAYKIAKRINKDNNEIFIIGGSQIYQQTFDNVEKLYVTDVEMKCEGDSYYKIPDNFILDKETYFQHEKGIDFRFLEYIKK